MQTTDAFKRAAVLSLLLAAAPVAACAGGTAPGAASSQAARQHATGKVKANGITLAYESFGRPDRPAIVLIQGLSVSLTGWPQATIGALVRRGYRVIVFDNRDIGLSERLESAPVPDWAAITAVAKGGPPLPYTLDDMAADTVGLMDGLGIRQAHVAGTSMGGQIAQLVAIHYPSRVLSLTSIMTDTGNPAREFATPEFMAKLMAPSPAGVGREGMIASAVASLRVLAGPGFPPDDAAARRDVERSLDHAPPYPAGTGRQFAAGVTAPDRREQLRQLKVPTVVLHGSADPLIPVSNAREQAAVIPGAELVIIPGMGHEIPPGAAGKVADAIARAAARGDRAAKR